MVNNQMLEFAKCAKDPVYYMNTYGYVFDARKKMVAQMTCFEYQNDCLRKFHEHQNNIILKSRQTGLSVITAGYVAWRLLFRYDEKILIIANDGAGAVRFLETVKQFIEHTPVWLKPDAIEQDNTKKIAFSNNSYAEAKASSPNAGRGDSLTMLILDETAFIKDDEAIWMGAGMALSATGGKCIMISTPNGTSGLYYKTWRETVSGDKSANASEDFVGTTVHWTENPNSAVGLEYKKDANGNEVPWSPWYEAQCKRLNWDSVQIAQELDLSFEGSKRLAVDAQLVSKYRARVEKDCDRLGYIKFDFMQKENPIEFAKFTLEETNMHIFKKPEEGRRYILAADVARGDGQDYSTMQILDAETLEQVAEYREKIGPDLFPFIINAVARMYNTAYVVIEANSFGLGVCFDIRDKFKYPRNKLYFSKNIKDIHVRHYSYKVNEGTEIPGFQTSRKNRVLLVKAIIEHMRESSLILQSKRLMMECDTFIMNGDKPEHEKGAHDDLIMALGIALYIRDTEFENVTSSVEMTKSMLNAMMMNTNSSTGNVNTPRKKNVDIKSGGGGLYIFNGNGDNVGGADNPDDDDISWLLG
jgi:hypothetical protein